jgi:hypothetical protein
MIASKFYARLALLPLMATLVAGCATKPPSEHEIEQCSAMKIERLEPEPGRYQMEHSPDAIFLLDTETGRIWVYQLNMWRELPPAPTTQKSQWATP